MEPQHPKPLPPPSWAARTVLEGAWITHESISRLHPHALLHWPPRAVADVRPVEISISVVDRLVPDRWVRSEPSVQVEGGAYPLTQVGELLRALTDVSALVGAPTAP